MKKTTQLMEELNGSDAIRKLYSNHELTEMEREYIKQGTKDREESEN